MTIDVRSWRSGQTSIGKEQLSNAVFDKHFLVVAVKVKTCVNCSWIKTWLSENLGVRRKHFSPLSTAFIDKNLFTESRKSSRESENSSAIKSICDQLMISSEQPLEERPTLSKMRKILGWKLSVQKIVSSYKLVKHAEQNHHGYNSKRPMLHPM